MGPNVELRSAKVSLILALGAGVSLILCAIVGAVVITLNTSRLHGVASSAATFAIAIQFLPFALGIGAVATGASGRAKDGQAVYRIGLRMGSVVIIGSLVAIGMMVWLIANPPK